MRLFLLTGAGALLAAGTTLATDYGSQRTLRIESEATISLAQTRFEMTVDGEPMEGGFGRGGERSAKTVRTTARTDAFLSSDEGRPTRVRRSFEDVSVRSEMSFGDETRSDERAAPLAGVTLELGLDDEGELEAKVVEGEEPDDHDALTALPLTLSVDALLPEAAVEVGDEWELASEAITQALSLVLDPKVFPAAEPEEEDREGGGRRGFRSSGAGDGIEFLREAEWEGTATLQSVEKGEDGEIAIVALEIRASGALPDPEFGGGGGRRRGFLLGSPAFRPELREGSFEVKLEGELQFAVGRNPVRLELKGAISTERRTTRDRGDRVMEIESEQEGELEFVVRVSVE